MKDKNIGFKLLNILWWIMLSLTLFLMFTSKANAIGNYTSLMDGLFLYQGCEEADSLQWNNATNSNVSTMDLGTAPDFDSGNVMYGQTSCKFTRANSDKIIYTSITQWKQSTGLSCAFWFKPITCSQENGLFSTLSTTGGVRRLASLDGTNHVQVIGDDLGGRQNYFQSSTTQYCNTGNWSLYYAEFQDNTVINKVIFNNLNLSGTIASYTNSITNENRFAFGAYSTGTSYGQYYNGYMDEMMCWNRSLTATETALLFNNKMGVFYNNFTQGGVPPVVNPTSVYNGKFPNDLSTANIFGLLNISYNVSKGTYDIVKNLLYFRVNDSTQKKLIYINGTAYDSFQSIGVEYNKSNSYYYRLNDNRYLPGNYLYNESKMENTLHSFDTISGSSNRIRCPIYNITDSYRPFGFYEAYVNMTANTGNGYTFYYVNSTGSAIPIVTELINPSLNHTHNQSKHWLFPVPSQFTGTVGVTDTGYIELRTNTGSTVEYGYISDAGGLCEKSINNGNTWTPFGYLDQHLHFFSNSTQLNFYQYTEDSSGYKINTTVQSDYIEFAGGIPPTSPRINEVIDSDLFYNITFSWINGFSPYGYFVQTENFTIFRNSTNVVYYNDDTKTNSTTKTFKFNDTGYYYIRIKNCDMMNSCSFGISNVFLMSECIPNYVNTTINATICSPLTYTQTLCINTTDVNFCPQDTEPSYITCFSRSCTPAGTGATNMTGVENALKNNGMRGEIYIWIILAIVFLAVGVLYEPVFISISGLFIVWTAFYMSYQGNISDNLATFNYYLSGFWFFLIIGAIMIILGITLQIMRNINSNNNEDFYSGINRRYR